MQQTIDAVLQFGEFATLVIAACVAIMLFVSFLELHPRHRVRDDKTLLKGEHSNYSKRQRPLGNYQVCKTMTSTIPKKGFPNEKKNFAARLLSASYNL